MNEVPTRAETMRKLEEVKDDLERQHERQKILEAKLLDRRNHLQAFNIILSNFQRFCAGLCGGFHRKYLKNLKNEPFFDILVIFEPF